MAEETNYVRQSVAERQAEILVAALEKAQANNGVLLNSKQKLMPVLLDKQLRISPSNALMMAMHSDLNDGKTNVYTLFSETKKRGEAVKKGQKGVPFTWTNNNEYVSKDNPEEKISRKEYLLLDDKDKAAYKLQPREEMNVLFNLDQTTMHHVHKEDYDKQFKEHGSIEDREAQRDDKSLRIEVNQYIQNVRDNLVNIRKDSNVIANYDAQKDIIHLPPQNNFDSYPDYVQETVRQIAHATGIQGRLNRDGAVFEGHKVPSEEKQQMELLAVELSSAHKMIELGLPAKLRLATVLQLPQIIEQLKDNPEMAEKVLRDVNRTVGMIKKAENGEKISLIEKPSEARQQKWADQFPLDKVPENFNHIVMMKDDEGKWALVAKPENERTFAIRPTAADVSMYFDMIKNDHDEEKTEQFRTQFAQKYYAEVKQHPDKEINLFKSEAPQEALDLISKVNAFKSKEGKIFLIATIGEDRQHPIELNQSQWNRMFLADDKRDYKVHLAAMLYPEALSAKLEEVKQKTAIEIDGTPKHEEKEHRVYHEKQEEEQKRQNTPEAKAKAEQEEKAKEEATKAETQAVAAIALTPMVRQFVDLKKKHPDALLLFRCGDFYETYMQDAEKSSKILGITLTKSSKTKDPEGKPLAMAGFPYHALDTYLPKLIRAGQRVAICDQIEAPKQTIQREEKAQTEQKQEQELKVGKEENQSRGFHR